MLLAAAAPAASPANPLAPAAQGKVECYAPDLARKTCKSMAAYRPQADGVYANLAVIMLQDKPLVVMQMLSPVRVRGGQVCGPVRDQDIDQATFEINGAAAPPDATAELRGKVRAQMAPLIGKEVCTQYLPGSGGAHIARNSEAGVVKPELDQKVIWVTKADGYKVAP